MVPVELNCPMVQCLKYDLKFCAEICPLGSDDHPRQYYEEDKGNCYWFKETECQDEHKQVPTQERYRECQWEPVQVQLKFYSTGFRIH